MPGQPFSRAAVLTDIRDLPAPSTLPISEVPLSFAFLALYTGDYLRDTRHLSPLRHGVYLLLLMYCWDTRGPLPFDEQEIAGIANCRSSDEIEALRYVLLRYFDRMEDGYYNQRIQREIERAHAISGKRSVAGLKGFQARAKQLLSKSQANGMQQHLPPPPPPSLPKALNLKVKSEKRPIASVATRLPENWTLPEEYHAWAVRFGMDERKAWLVGADFKDFWIAKNGPDAMKRNWFATWRRWIRTTLEKTK
jgi:uncharacterized protein YdaU (DUF1376 family)